MTNESAMTNAERAARLAAAPRSLWLLDSGQSVVQGAARLVAGVLVLAILGVSAFGISFDDDLRSLRPQQASYQSAQKELEAILGGTGGYLLFTMEDENNNLLLNRALLLNNVLERLQAEEKLASYRSVLSYLPAPESLYFCVDFGFILRELPYVFVCD